MTNFEIISNNKIDRKRMKKRGEMKDYFVWVGAISVISVESCNISLLFARFTNDSN